MRRTPSGKVESTSKMVEGEALRELRPDAQPRGDHKALGDFHRKFPTAMFNFILDK
jgi:hypothetical protein